MPDANGSRSPSAGDAVDRDRRLLTAWPAVGDVRSPSRSNAGLSTWCSPVASGAADSTKYAVCPARADADRHRPALESAAARPRRAARAEAKTTTPCGSASVDSTPPDGKPDRARADVRLDSRHATAFAMRARGSMHGRVGPSPEALAPASRSRHSCMRTGRAATDRAPEKAIRRPDCLCRGDRRPLSCRRARRSSRGSRASSPARSRRPTVMRIAGAESGRRGCRMQLHAGLGRRASTLACGCTSRSR